MSASISDLLTQATVSSRPVPTQVSTIRTAGNATLNVLGLSGWPTGTAVHGCTYKLTTAGVKVAGSQIDFKAIVNGSNQLTSFTVRAGTDSGHAVGDIVECAPTAAYANDLQAWGSVHADSQGNLLGTAVRTALNQTAATGAGWTTLGYQPNTVTYNGNRSYTCVFNGVDLTPTISPAMRLMFQRTVAAPTTSSSLNGTTQFWSKTSPAGMTFTNNFVAGGWVKLTSYPASAEVLISRYNGTSGWALFILSTGQVQLNGYNAGAGNTSAVNSYHSVPLNKWVHIAAQLDMATFTATTTTSYVMIDGVDCPSVVSRSGTNPTSLIQAGNLEVGSWNGGLLPFAGKVEQAFVTSAKVTQATIQSNYYAQTVSPTETSVISTFPFNGNGNDANTTNANNLTANGSVTATAADAPFSVQANGTPNGSLDYGIVQSATFSTNTTVVVQVPEGCTIPTSGGVSAVSYATVKAPYGMPVQVNKWRVTCLGKTQANFNGSGALYNLVGSLAVTAPLGEWTAGFSGDIFMTTTSTVWLAFTTSDLSAVSSTVVAAGTTPFTCRFRSGSGEDDLSAYMQKPQSVTSQTTYKLWSIGGSGGGMDGGTQVTELWLDNAYL